MVIKKLIYTYTYHHRNIDQLFFAIQHRHVCVQWYEHWAYLDHLNCIPIINIIVNVCRRYILKLSHLISTSIGWFGWCCVANSNEQKRKCTISKNVHIFTKMYKTNFIQECNHYEVYIWTDIAPRCSLEVKYLFLNDSR
jgi:hypothetical protein